MKTKKAGCILVNLKNKKIALVLRTELSDCSFPKGHLENGETLQECALRETEEETGHICHLVDEKELAILKYKSLTEDVETYMYLAVDDGETSRKIPVELQEETIWKSIDEIEKILTYKNLKDFWRKNRKQVEMLINA